MDVNKINKTLWSMMDFEKLRPDNHLGHPIMLIANASTTITSDHNSKTKKCNNNTLNFYSTYKTTECFHTFFFLDPRTEREGAVKEKSTGLVNMFRMFSSKNSKTSSWGN